MRSSTRQKRKKTSHIVAELCNDYTDVLKSEIWTADRHYKNPHTADEEHSYLCTYVGDMSSVYDQMR